MSRTRWSSISADCAGQIDSVVEPLQRCLARGVMERICRPASVDEKGQIAGATLGLPLSGRRPSQGGILTGEGLAGLFCLDLGKLDDTAFSVSHGCPHRTGLAPIESCPANGS